MQAFRWSAPALALVLVGAPVGVRGRVAAQVADSAVRRAATTDLGGGVYIFYYRPVDLAGARPNTEIYAAFVSIDHQGGPWRLHAQARGRDTKLRSWYTGTVWLQEAWVSYAVRPDTAPAALTLRAGKMYQTFGRFWDGSFFGNIPYFDGLKLNPQFAVEATGALGTRDVRLGLTGQYIVGSDHVSGAFAGRDFETLDGSLDRQGGTVRVTVGLPRGLTLGGSYLSRAFADDSDRFHRVPHVGVDAAWVGGPVEAYGEWSRRDGGGLPGRLAATIPGSAARHRLVGGQYNLRRLHVRYNYSRGDYRTIDRADWIHQPGLTVDLSPNAHAYVEWDLWRTRVAGVTSTYDRSLNLVLLLTLP